MNRRPEVVWDNATGIPTYAFVNLYDRFTAAIGGLRKDIGVAVVGGIAVNLHTATEARKTTDVDVVLDVPRSVLSNQNRTRALILEMRALLESSKFTVTEPVGGNRGRNGMDFIVNDSVYQLRDKVECADIRVPNGIKIDTYYSRSQSNLPLSHIVRHAVPIMLTSDGVTYTVSVASIPTLVQMKLTAARTRDLKDIIKMMEFNYHGSVDEFINDDRTVAEFGQLEAKKKGMPTNEVRFRLNAIMKAEISGSLRS